VEYFFQNSILDSMTTITLRHYAMSIRKGLSEELVFYSSIAKVRLSWLSKDVFRISLYTDEGVTIMITNKVYVAEQARYQLNAYTVFVKALHYHLKHKSCAIFLIRHSINKALPVYVLPFFFLIIPSFCLYYFGLTLLNPYFQIVLLVLVFAITIDWINKRTVTKYDPANIPMHFLP